MMENLLFAVKNSVAYVTLNRPDKLNALNFKMLEELSETINEIHLSKQVRGVIITGTGHKAFVAGADINEFTTIDPDKATSYSEKGQRVFQQIEECSKPIIAAVNGFALGGGCELALACHLRVLSEQATLGQPEINLGIVPGYGGTQRLTNLVGRGKAVEWMMTADFISAQEALQWGLANHVVPHAELISFCEKIMSKIVEKPPIAISEIIKATNANFEANKSGYQTEAQSFARCVNTKDFKEGVDAFLEKRKPHFIGE